MGWVRWLKDMVERLPDDEPRSPPVRQPQPRRGKGGDAYAKEWVKVLDDASTRRDPNATYTWELHPEADQPPATGADAGARPTRGKGKRDPFDTYTWEVTETDSVEDPWGLKTEQPKPQETGDGVNPYDTGVFNAGWTGRFDRR
jgi:hypothetical protein